MICIPELLIHTHSRTSSCSGWLTHRPICTVCSLRKKLDSTILKREPAINPLRESQMKTWWPEVTGKHLLPLRQQSVSNLFSARNFHWLVFIFIFFCFLFHCKNYNMLPYNLFLIPSSHIIIFPLHKYLPCLSCLSLLCLFCVIWFLIHINSINCKLVDFPNRTLVLFSIT